MKQKNRALTLTLAIAITLSMLPAIAGTATANDNVYPQAFNLEEIAPRAELIAHFDFEGLTPGSTDAIPSLGGLDAKAEPKTGWNTNGNVTLSTNVQSAAIGGAHSYSLGSTETDTVTATGSATANRWLNVVKNDGTALLAGAEEFVVTFNIRRSGGNTQAWPFYVDANQQQNVYLSERYIGVTHPSNGQMRVERFSNGRPGNEFNAQGAVPTGTNTWYSIAIVARPHSTAIYSNGALVGSAATSGEQFTLPNIFGATGGFVQLGKANWTASGEFFSGLIDNVMIYATYPIPVERGALLEVIEEYLNLDPANYTPTSWASAATAYNSATAVYNDTNATQEQVDAAAANLRAAIDALVSTGPDVDKAPLEALIASAPTDADAYTTATWQALQTALLAANAVIANPDATQGEVNNAYTALQAAIDGLVPYASFSENLLVHYDFTDVSGTQVRDSSGNDNHGILVNNASVVEVPGDQKALNLATGSNQHLRMPQGFMTGPDVNNYTISLYMKQSQAQAAAWVLSLANSSDAGYLFIAPNTGGGNLRYAISSSNWNAESGVNVPGLAIDRWYHIVARQDGNNMTLFLDGVQVGTATTSLRVGTVLTASSNAHYLGRSAYSADPYWKGQISDFRIFTTAMSNEDIARLYETLRIVDPFEISSVSAPGEHPHQKQYDHAARVITLPVRPGTDISDLAVSITYDTEFATISPDPATVRDYSGPVQYTMTSIKTGETAVYTINVLVWNNPVIPGSQADPEILAASDEKYYIYSTTCGSPGWGGYDFRVYSSEDLVHWVDEGVIIDVRAEAPYLNHKDEWVGIVEWANGNAWAPAIIEKDGMFYFYFSGHHVGLNQKAITVAVSESPTGPFKVPDELGGEPMLTQAMTFTGQAIDPGVFRDPVSGDHFIYWGQSTDCTAAKLNGDMISIDMSTRTRLRLGNTFREGIYVFYNDAGNPNGNYYFTWSEDDTGSENYKVRWGVSDHPLGSNPGGTTTGNPSRVTGESIMIQKDTANGILATGHHSILKIPGMDRWFINYHRFVRFGGAGHNRETCLDEFFFDANGRIIEVRPTLEGVLTPIRVGDKAINVKAAADALELYGIDDVRHNITMPESGLHNTTITWASSHPGVITDEAAGGKAPGVVTRPLGGDAIEVTLTATITDPSNGATLEKVFTANVTPIDPGLDKDYTAGYIWTYFNRTTLVPTGTSGTSNERYKIFYGFSYDGLHWNTLNRTAGTNTANPVAESIVGFTGVRDPHIIRSYEGDKYWIIGTDLQEGFDQQTGSRSLLVWESYDMITWSDSRLEMVFPDAGNVWAPEAYYDVEAGDWLVYWASRDRRDTGNANKLRMYVSRTRDFKTFTDPIIWGEEPGVGHNLIDTSIMHVNGLYYRMHTSDWFTIVDYSPTLSTNAADWTKIMARGESDSRGLDRIEGLTTYKLPDGRWVTMGDNNAYRGFWIEEEDFHSQMWTRNATTGTHSRANTFRSGTANATFRHGTVMRLSATEEQRLMAAMGAGWNYDPAPRYSTYVKSGTSDPMVTTEGGNVRINYVAPGAGATFSHWKAEGIELTPEQKGATEFTFAMPANNVRIYECEETECKCYEEQWEKITFLRINLAAITRVPRNGVQAIGITVNEGADPGSVTLTVSNTAMAEVETSSEGIKVTTKNRAGTVTLTATYRDEETTIRHSVTLMIT